MTPTRHASILLMILTVIFVPGGLTLSTVRDPRPRVPVDIDPSPLGYTWSLLLFLTPIVILGVWFYRHPRYAAKRRAFLVTVTGLSLLGIVLDFLFGDRFFDFPNTGANLGLHVCGVPVEEILFYASGFAAVLLTYIWLSEYWLGEYRATRAELAEARRTLREMVGFHYYSIAFALVLIVAAAAAKKLGPYPDGFPGYFAYLVAVAFLPSVGFYPAVRSVVNWQAMNFTSILLLFVSVFWEGVLAVPYQWWAYRPEQMIGIEINAMSGLPVEAVFVWVLVTYAAIILYEVAGLAFGPRRSPPGAVGA